MAHLRVFEYFMWCRARTALDELVARRTEFIGKGSCLFQLVSVCRGKSGLAAPETSILYFLASFHSVLLDTAVRPCRSTL
jgi:hypothetical protein